MKSRNSETIVFSPFTRIEGDLRLYVDVADGRVQSARACGTLFRGFEDLVHGRNPLDAIVFLCRICGQCGAAHSAAASAALANAFGITPPPNALYVRAVLVALETILSHLSHFYVSFAPTLFASENGEISERFAPMAGISFRNSLRARHTLLAMMGLIAGKWPNTLVLHPGGVTHALNTEQLTRAKGIFAEFTSFLVRELLGCEIETWLENDSLKALDAWMGKGGHADSDIGRFVAAALTRRLDRMGRGPGRFLSCGGGVLPGGETWLGAGYYEGGLKPFAPDAIEEDVSFAWYERDPVHGHPSQAVASAASAKSEAYSWGKAVRYAGKSAEVGPMARMVIDADPLAMDLLRNPGPSVFSRALLRLHELVRLAKDVPSWLDLVDPEAPFYLKHELPECAEGFAVTEAPRGMLGHWVRIEKALTKTYQVVTPTGWNLSPRDRNGAPGPLEEALEGTPVCTGQEAANVHLVVSSYDPCLYCSVH